MATNGKKQGQLFGPPARFPTIESLRPHGAALRCNADFWQEDARERLRQIYGRECVERACQIYESEKLNHIARTGTQSPQAYGNAIARICRRIKF